MTKSTIAWEISAGCSGSEVVKYCSSADEVLDFCGRLLYGNTLFEILMLHVRQMQHNQPTYIGDEFWSGLKEDTQWVMRIMECEGGFRERQLSSKHELFAMLVAELRLGRTQIEVRHISNVCERE